MLTQQQLDKFKRELLAMRVHMLNRIEGMNEGGMGESMSNSFGELSTYDNHPGDVGSEMFERGKDFALREDAMAIVGAIDDALDKMEAGKYGLCEVCNKEIAYERLEAVPYTTQCVDCKSRDEHLPKSHERTAEEDVLDTPFSRSWKDGEDYNGFDGEDAWESVAIWNEHAERAQAGSYYGDEEMINEEHLETFEDPDSVPYEIGEDGVIYESFRGVDDESSPYERINVGSKES
ncbi:TraR/DksA C4-type zinc finger protein [Desulfotomaculum defluvii]